MPRILGVSLPHRVQLLQDDFVSDFTTDLPFARWRINRLSSSSALRLFGCLLSTRKRCSNLPPTSKGRAVRAGHSHLHTSGNKTLQTWCKEAMRISSTDAGFRGLGLWAIAASFFGARGSLTFSFLFAATSCNKIFARRSQTTTTKGRTTVMYTRKMIRTWLTVAMVMASAERAHAFGTLVRAPRLHLCKFFHVYVSQKNFMRACCHIHKPRIRTKYITCNIGQTKLLRTGKRVIARPSFYAQPPCRCKTRTVRSRCRHPRRSWPTSWRVQWASEASFMWACSFSSSSWSSSRLPFKILSRPLVSSQVCPFNVTSRATL
jgi:hypothetical protein